MFSWFIHQLLAGFQTNNLPSQIFSLECSPLELSWIEMLSRKLYVTEYLFAMNIKDQSHSKLSYFKKALSNHQDSGSVICKFCSNGDKIKKKWGERVNVIFFFFFFLFYLKYTYISSENQRGGKGVGGVGGWKKAGKLTPNSIYWIRFSYIT